MVDGGEGVVLAMDPGAVLSADAVVGSEQALGGDASEADDDFWLQQGGFTAQVGEAAFLLQGLGVAVVRRMAFEDIGDVDFFAGEAAIGEQPLKELARGTHKGDAGFILLDPGGFCDKHNFCLMAATPHDCSPAGLGQGTGLAMGD